MKLREGSALLVLSGQGVGNGVEHFVVPFSVGRDYPQTHLLEEWCSLSDPLIPTHSQDLVLMIARHATKDGTPWVVLSQYVQAHLRGSKRGKQYAGVSLVAPEILMPTSGVDLVFKTLKELISERMDGRVFLRSLADWIPPDPLLRELEDLEVELLPPRFGGVQPGREQGRIFSDHDPEQIVRAAQEGEDYANYCAAFVLRRDEKPDRDTYFVRSRYEASSRGEALEPSTPPPAGRDRVPLTHTADLSGNTPGRRRDGYRSEATSEPFDDTEDDGLRIRSRGAVSSSIVRLESDLKELENRVDTMAASMRSFITECQSKRAERNPLTLLEWTSVISTVLMMLFIAGLFWEYVVKEHVLGM